MDAHQKDFLTEVLNIGLGRAGAVVGEMSGTQVDLVVPDITVCSIAELPMHLHMFGKGEIMSVTQTFDGILCGDAILVLSKFSGKTIATSLFRNMLGTKPEESEIESAITELGNVVINHFVGSWSKIFYDQFHFGVPEFKLCPLETLLDDRVNAKSEDRGEIHAICAEAHVDVPEFFAMVSLVTLFDKATLEKLVGSLTEAAASKPKATA